MALRGAGTNREPDRHVPPRPIPLDQQSGWVLLALALIGLFLADLVLPRDIVVLPYYWLPVVLAAAFASPIRVLVMGALALALSLASGIHWAFFPSLDFLSRLVGLTGVGLMAVVVAARRRQSERELRATKDQYQLLLDNSADMIFRSTPEAVFEWVSPAARSLLGCEPEQLVGRSAAAFIEPADLPRLQQATEQILAGRPITYELRLRTASGETRWASVAIKPVLDGEGRVIARVGSCRDVHAAVEARLARAQAEQLFRMAMDNAAVGNALLDPGGAILRVNPALCQFLGREPKQLMQTSWSDLIDPEDLAAEQPLRRDMEANRRNSYRLTARFCRPEGPPVWGDLSVSCIRDADGGVSTTILQITDISELKRVEGERERAASFYLQLLNDAPALIWRAGLDGLCDWFNATWLAFTGRTLEQEVGNGWTEGVHPDDLAGCLQIYLEAFAERRSFVMEYRLRRHDGEYRWISDNGIPFTGLDGAFGGYIGYCFDVTERRRQEEQLARRAARDPLTGLLNRQEVTNRIDTIVRQQPRTGSRTAVLFCDLDHFKAINDQHGHAAGDDLLRGVARRIGGCLRAGDLAGRLGGDELLVVLEGVQGLDNAVQIAEKIRKAVAEPIPTVAGPLAITTTIGVAVAQGGESVGALIARADGAMYAGKGRGRDRVIPIQA